MDDVMQYFGVADGVEVDGYLYEEGDVMVLTFQRITPRNEEQQIAVAVDYTVGERLRTLLDDRVRTEGKQR